MNTEQQRIAIAEACGWTKVKAARIQASFSLTWRDFVNGLPPDAAKDDPYSAVPDYLNDLNAMHEAEQKMEYWDGYISNLKFICGDPQSEGYSTHKAYRATAAQRAEAFLKTLNLWEN